MTARLPKKTFKFRHSISEELCIKVHDGACFSSRREELEAEEEAGIVTRVSSSDGAKVLLQSTQMALAYSRVYQICDTRKEETWRVAHLFWEGWAEDQLQTNNALQQRGLPLLSRKAHAPSIQVHQTKMTKALLVKNIGCLSRMA